MNLSCHSGNYSITVALHSGAVHIDGNYEWRDIAAVFQVENETKKPFTGVAFLNAEIFVNGEKMGDKL